MYEDRMPRQTSKWTRKADENGLMVVHVEKMQDRRDKEGRTLPGRSFKNPLEIVHVSAASEFYGIDIRDVWPLFYKNVMGNRVPFNTGERALPPSKAVEVLGDRPTGVLMLQPEITEDAKKEMELTRDEEEQLAVVTHTERRTRLETDERGEAVMKDYEANVVQCYGHEIDDGIYVRKSDLLRYAKQHGWTKGGGLPENMAAANARQTSQDITAVLAQISQAMAQQAESSAQILKMLAARAK